MPLPANKVIILTAPGVSALAAIRLRGAGVRAFMGAHFTRALQDGAATYGRLVDGPVELDDPVVAWDERTQTADVFTHGGRWVVRSVVELAVREGFELEDASLPLDELAVDSDEVLVGEILRYLPMVRTREAISTLLAQRQAWAELDWSDTALLRAALEDRSLHWLLHPPRVAIIGVPNAGKSTLANAIFRQERSIVADVPGTTRDYVEQHADLSGLAVVLVDTPGLRHSGDALEMMAIGNSADQIESADLRIVLLDPTQEMPPQLDVAQRYRDALLVSGKSDLKKGEQGLMISAATRIGLDELELAIRRRFGCETLPHGRCCAWTQRQRDLLQDALRSTGQ